MDDLRERNELPDIMASHLKEMQNGYFLLHPHAPPFISPLRGLCGQELLHECLTIFRHLFTAMWCQSDIHR